MNESETEYEEMETKKMENTLSANDIALGSLFASQNGNGRNGGAWNGGGYNISDFPAMAVRSNRNDENIKSEAGCTRDMIKVGQAGISDAFENAERSRQIADVNQGQFQAELRTGDKIAAVIGQIGDLRAQLATCCCENQKIALETQIKSLECCCEAKLLAVTNKSEILASASNDKAEILAAIAASANATISRELAASLSKVNQLEIINACNSSHHGGGH